VENNIIERAVKLNTTVLADAMGSNAVMDYQNKSVTNKAKGDVKL
jgi:hypothetical protein